VRLAPVVDPGLHAGRPRERDPRASGKASELIQIRLVACCRPGSRPYSSCPRSSVLRWPRVEYAMRRDGALPQQQAPWVLAVGLIILERMLSPARPSRSTRPSAFCSISPSRSAR
jgi:hypothetical protein